MAQTVKKRRMKQRKKWNFVVDDNSVKKVDLYICWKIRDQNLTVIGGGCGVAIMDDIALA